MQSKIIFINALIIIVAFVRSVYTANMTLTCGKSIIISDIIEPLCHKSWVPILLSQTLFMIIDFYYFRCNIISPTVIPIYISPLPVFILKDEQFLS